jgi:hypothetical protein
MGVEWARVPYPFGLLPLELVDHVRKLEVLGFLVVYQGVCEISTALFFYSPLPRERERESLSAVEGGEAFTSRSSSRRDGLVSTPTTQPLRK